MSRRSLLPAGLIALAALFQPISSSAAISAVRLTPTQERSMGLQASVATAATQAPLATLPAIAAPPLNGRVVAATPFSGVVVRVDVLEGQSVRAGQPLAVIFSQDALRVASDLTQARAEARAAAAAANRTRQLAKEGIIAGARAEEAQARATQTQALVNEKQRLLAGAGGGARQGEYVLRSPIAGRVSQLNLQPGGGLEAMAAAAVIDRDDRLWVEARLPASLIGKVRVGGAVEVNGRPGTVIAAGSAIDPRTRSAVLRAELAAGSGLVPGRSTSITLMGPVSAGGVSIPRASLTRLDNRDAVFVKTLDGYRVQFVQILGLSASTAVVTGLRPGSLVASAGVSQLKAAVGR